MSSRDLAAGCAEDAFTFDASRYLNCPSNRIGHDHPNKPANGVGNNGTFNKWTGPRSGPDSKNSTTAPVDQTRRGFLAIAGGAGAAAVAITPAAALSQPQDDGRLLELEEQILEAHNAAKAHDDEIIPLQVIW